MITRNKILPICIALILLSTSLTTTISGIEVCGSTNGNLNDSEVVKVRKLIKSQDCWVDITNASVNDVLRFRITIAYKDSDGDGPAYCIRNITIVDTLPEGLEYLGNSTKKETSKQGNVVIWDLGEYFSISENTSPFILEFDVKVNREGYLQNIVNVSALEKCVSIWRYVSASAIVNASISLDYRSIDVEPDGNNEYAYDSNGNSSDGFEQYFDPDNSSEAVKSIDGDSDSKIDHFVDINKDGIPDKYWDPDDGILRSITIEDVDYDGTEEWVYDSKGDGKDDRYFDPDDGKIYRYEIFILKLESDGHGSINKEPNGEKFLTWKLQQVKLTAIAEDGYIFDYWSGDVPTENRSDNPVTVVMDRNRTIKAHFRTIPNDTITLKIIKPKENWVYKDNIPIRKKILDTGTEIIGPITIKVKAKSDNGIDRVEFYIDGELKHTDSKGLLNIYKWTWVKLDDKSNKTHTIKVIAYDKKGNSKTIEMEVIREKYKPIRDHPLLTIGGIAGILLILKNRFKSGEGTEETSEPGEVDTVPPEIEIPSEGGESPVEEGHEPEEGLKGTDLFWYIVGGLSIVLLAIIGTLYGGRKIYG